MTRPGYLMRVGDAVSQLLNVSLLNGDANESISGRAYREQWTLAVHVIDFLFLWDSPEHCRDAYNADVERARVLVYQDAGIEA